MTDLDGVKLLSQKVRDEILRSAAILRPEELALSVEAIFDRALSPTPEAPGTGGAGARAQVFTYEHSPMGDGRYVTTISNDPPPPTLWCRVKRFTPATPAETQADEVGL